MKAIVVLSIAALLSGVGTVGVITTQSGNQARVIQRECVLQCPNVDVQPAVNTVQITSTAPLQATAEPELQPALGYKALDWHVDNLEVQ